MDRTEQYKKIHEEAFSLFKKKNTDYGDAFATDGCVGVLVRLGDKLNRLKTVTATSVSLVNTETLRDTLIDIHNYSAMAIMLSSTNPRN
jgi:hypothetical protein